MKYVRAFGKFWWDFVVGDDWRVALGLAGTLALTWLLTDNGINAWWLLPIAVVALLGGSLVRATNTRD